MKIAICDDNKHDIEAIRCILLNNDYMKQNGQITVFTSSSELHEDLKKSVYDVVFLDVDMPEINGIELGKYINQKSPNTYIIFVTNYSQYAVEAFDCEAFHYLLKPIDEYKANRIINNLIQKYRERNKYHVIKIKTETKRIPIKDIYYIEYCRRHVIYHLKDRVYETVGKFSDIYKELKEFGFYQIHQGYIVNMEKIIDFDKFSVILQDDKTVMMSTRKRSEVIMAYAKYIEVHK